MSEYYFSVFTPTDKRAETIKKTFLSLQMQSMKNFEWIVIDDGSTDNTKEVVKAFEKKAGFPIVFLSQKNSGKHVAQNKAVEIARGELFLPLDADDTILPICLETMWKDWQSLSEEERKNYSGIGYHCEDAHGIRIGAPWPYDGIVSNDLEMKLKYKIDGEKYGPIRTDIIKLYKNPEIKGHYFSESTMWYRIAKKYQKKYFNKNVRVYEVHTDSLTTLNKADSTYNTESNYEAALIYINEFSQEFFKYNQKMAWGGQVLRCIKYGILLDKRILWGKDAIIKRVKPFYAKIIVVLVSPYKIIYKIRKSINKG